MTPPPNSVVEFISILFFLKKIRNGELLKLIQFGRLLSYPLEFRNLEDKIKDVQLSNIKVVKMAEDQILITSTANNHEVQILVLDKVIQVNSPIVCSCTCEFFSYSLAFGLHQQKSLLNPDMFVLRPPKKKNTSLVLSGCKHIIKTARDVLSKKYV